MKISVRVKERLAKVIGQSFSTSDIVNIFADLKVQTNVELYAKWRIILDALSKMPDPNDGLFQIIGEFCHPINFTDLGTRKNFIANLNDVLRYEDLIIDFDDKTIKIVPLENNAITGADDINSYTYPVKENEPLEKNKCSFSSKVLELVATEFEKSSSNNNVRHIITPLLEKNVSICNDIKIKEYLDDWLEEKPWQNNLRNVFDVISEQDKNADLTISEIIATLLHPLNHNADEKKAGELAVHISKYLKYDDFLIEKDDKKYTVLSKEELKTREKYVDVLYEEFKKPPQSLVKEIEKNKEHDKKILVEQKDILKTLRESHQSYIDVIELFCSDVKKPTKDLNEAYTYLAKNITKDLKSLNLKHYVITLYKPFNDLYKAEVEWNGTGAVDDIKLGPKLSWDAIRPSLYLVHSDIVNLSAIADEDTEMSSGEKRLEEITSFISQQRTKKITPENEKVEKVEILHKYEKTQEKDKIKLSEYDVSFDDETTQLSIGDFKKVGFPPHKNEHYLLRKLFSHKKKEVVDWQEIYEAMTQTKTESLDKAEIEKQMRSVKDTVRAINNRVKEVCNSDSDLLLWEIKCVKRLH